MTRAITSYAQFRTLPRELKQEYASALQRTYHIALHRIRETMPDSPKYNSFSNYLRSQGVRPTGDYGALKTSELWPEFVAGKRDIYGKQIDPSPAENFADNPEPMQPGASLTLEGPPSLVLKLLSTSLAELIAPNEATIRVKLNVMAEGGGA